MFNPAVFSPEAMEMLAKFGNECAVSFFRPRRTVFDSIFTPMNVWKKQFTTPLFSVRIRMPQRFRAA